jgi:hypothetical protein
VNPPGRSPEPDSLPPEHVDGGRYTIQRALGRGGMAQVYEAIDAANGGRRVALKRLRDRKNAQLFEREFHALAQLAHPRVVEVYEFGIDETGPYYTMELLDGGDLHQLAPLPWRETCVIGRDICSALSLLHSRRLVHRDVSPRNVRRTADGFAKLFDFGALAPFGPSKLLVGTPPCSPPESVQSQRLDARTDLYALGATLYYLLVGRHAYVARDFSELREAWLTGFVPAGELVEGLPDALDTLVLDLLRLNPGARPANASEVMQRLAAIDGDFTANQLQVAQAYLSTPTLVGRDIALARLRRHLNPSNGKRARNIVIEGASGVGRTRFLDTCLLEASLVGRTVLRADGDGTKQAYGVVRALCRQLMNLVPQIALETAQPRIELLAHLAPELRQKAGLPETGSSDGPVAAEIEPALQTAVREWWSAIQRRRKLVIGVDDFHRVDRASAATIVLAALDDAEHGPWIVVSTEREAQGSASEALKLLLPATARIPLANLTEANTEVLLASLFGQVPNLGVLASRAQRLCSGNPRDLLRLAQHLVDRGIVRYDAGAWTLPAQLDAADLPGSIADALRARITAQRSSARQLACALALCTDEDLTFEECGRLCDHRDPDVLRSDIDALIRAEILRYAGDKLGLTHSSWIPLLRADLTPAVEQAIDQRLASVFEQRGDSEFLAAQHWLRAGERAHALDILVRHAELMAQSVPGSAAYSAQAFRAPRRDWRETYDLAIRACDELSRPARDKFVLLHRVTSLGALLGRHDTVHMPALLAQLRRCSGLEDYSELDPSLPASARLQLALERAQARHAATPEHERALTPEDAIKQLVRTVSALTGIAALAFDLSYLREAPDLAPLGSLTPTIGTIYNLTRGMEYRLTGSIEQARALYCEMLERLESSDHGGLDLGNLLFTRAGLLNALGLLDSGSGLPSCIAYADALEAIPAFDLNAVLIRMLHLLFQGDGIGAEHRREQADRMRLQTGSRPMYGGGHLIWELQAHAISEDLTRMRHVIDEIAPLAKLYPGWQPILHYGVAEHQRMRGSPWKAVGEIEAALRLAAPGGHQIWPALAVSHVRVLLDLERPDEAIARARSNVLAAQTAFGRVPPVLHLVLSFAEAHAATDGRAVDPAHVIARADAAIAELIDSGVRGIRVGFAHELRARIALLQKDSASLDRQLKLCRAAYCAYDNPALVAKYQRLDEHAGNARGVTPFEARVAKHDASSESMLRVAAAFESCHTPAKRAAAALRLLLEQSGARAGFFFSVGPVGAVCEARAGEDELDPELVANVDNYLHDAIDATNTTQSDTGTTQAIAPEWASIAGQRYVPVLLSHSAEGALNVVGIAALAVHGDQPLSNTLELASMISRVIARSADTWLVVNRSDGRAQTLEDRADRK